MIGPASALHTSKSPPRERRSGVWFDISLSVCSEVRAVPLLGRGIRCWNELSLRRNKQHRLSRIGNSVTRMTHKERGGLSARRLTWSRHSGLFWDNDGLFARGLIVRGKSKHDAQLQVYPGLVDFHGIRPDATWESEAGGARFGVTFNELRSSIGIREMKIRREA